MQFVVNHVFYAVGLFIVITLTSCKDETETNDSSLSSIPFISDGYPSVTIDGEFRYGYSVSMGDTVNFHINAVEPYAGDISVTDIQGKVITVVNGVIYPQQTTTERPWEQGFGYDVSFKLNIDDKFRTGVYLINGQEELFFVVKSSTNEEPIIAVIPTNTMNAYSCHGGHSAYSCSGADPKPRLSFLRPLTQMPQYVWEVSNFNMIIPTLTWLHQTSGYKDNIQYITDHEMLNIDKYKDAQVLMILGHNEYWSIAAQQAFERYIAQGKDSIILGGNIMWWNSRYEENQTVQVSHKSMSVDENYYDQPTYRLHQIGFSAEERIGALFEYGGYDKNEWSGIVEKGANPMKVLVPESPILFGTEFNLCDPIDMGAHHEMDGPPLLGFDRNGFPVVNREKLNGVHQYEILAYTWGYRLGHTIGTVHAFKKYENSGSVLQYASNGSVKFALNASTKTQFEIMLKNSIQVLLDGDYPFSQNFLANDVVHKLETPYGGELEYKDKIAVCFGK